MRHDLITWCQELKKVSSETKERQVEVEVIDNANRTSNQ